MVRFNWASLQLNQAFFTSNQFAMQNKLYRAYFVGNSCDGVYNSGNDEVYLTGFFKHLMMEQNRTNRLALRFCLKGVSQC